MINKNRLAEIFLNLVKIDSESKNEKDIALFIREKLEPLDCDFFIDSTMESTKSNTGNLIVRFKGNCDAAPMLLSAHMDTVSPGNGVNVKYENGVFTTDGSTVLGADDKSAIAVIIEILRVVVEKKVACPSLEIVFTVCEEIGLLGAKSLDFSQIKSKFGYVLDTFDTKSVVTRAPGANSFTFKVHGVGAHAGAFPELGINAIACASRAINNLFWGRVDHETTCNIGMIEGGIATNIVPDFVKVKGEVRSHSKEKLDMVTNRIVDAFTDAASEFKPCPGCHGKAFMEISYDNDFPMTNIPHDHKLVKLAEKAAINLEQSIKPVTTGGGSDANIFFQNGVCLGVLGTGMKDVHTVRESVCIDDMEYAGRLVLEIIKNYVQE